jgi:hypothetical protein
MMKEPRAFLFQPHIPFHTILCLSSPHQPNSVLILRQTRQPCFLLLR